MSVKKFRCIGAQKVATFSPNLLIKVEEIDSESPTKVLQLSLPFPSKTPVFQIVHISNSKSNFFLFAFDLKLGKGKHRSIKRELEVSF